MNFVNAIAFTFVLFFLSTVTQTILANSVEPSIQGLKRSMAEERSQLMRGVSYELFMDISSKGTSEGFEGDVTTRFFLKSVPEVLPMDFKDGNVVSIVVNGTPIEVSRNSERIFLDGKYLKPRQNLVSIKFTQNYSNDGDGLYRFVDPNDSKVYIYSNFEPFDANKVFPCFDQPDLKAAFRLKVKADANVVVVSSTREESSPTSTQDETSTRLWTFPESLPISTYVFSLHAGEFHIWEDSYTIPLRLMARKSLAKYIDADQWFSVTKKGFDYFTEYLGSPYPFSKYDQIIVPHFNPGAMENVAAVTFNERFVKRGTMQPHERRSLYATILHEQAHMWFGNLVTPVWWNDLWLNESFATFMASQALVATTEFKDGFRHLGGQRAEKAYEADSTSVARSIVSDVHSTEDASAIFDSITYTKGALMLRQLEFAMDSASFRLSLAQYLTRFRFKVATYEDFFAIISKHAPHLDMNSFIEENLKTPGVNTVEVDYKCSQQNTIKELRIEQILDRNYPRFRPMKVAVGLYKIKPTDPAQQTLANPIEFVHQDTVAMIKSNQSIDTLVGQVCPDLVIPNHNGRAYTQVRLDDKSLQTAIQNPRGLTDPELRDRILFALNHAVNEGRLPLSSFSKALLVGLAEETDDVAVSNLLQSMKEHLVHLGALYRQKNKKSTPMESSLAVVDPFESILSKRWQDESASSPIKTAYFDAWVEVVESQAAISHIADLAQLALSSNTDKLAATQSSNFLEGIDLNHDRQWAMLQRLAEKRHPKTLSLFEKLAKNDQSDRAWLAKKTVSFILAPDQERMLTLMRVISPEAPLAAKVRLAILETLDHSQGEEIKQQFLTELLAKSDAIVSGFRSGLSGKIISGLLPRDCKATTIELAEKLIMDKHSWTAPVIKQLKRLRDEQTRCLEIVKSSSQIKNL